MRARRAGWMAGTALALGLLVAARAEAQPASPGRVALVIGEGAYRAGALPAAPNDAGLVAQVLAGAGFDVTGARDLDGDGMRRAFRDFLDKAGAAGPDGIAVVYLAGRAIQFDGENFVVPVEARLARPADVPIEALRLADFTHALAALPIQARVVVVDGAYAGGPAQSAPGLALAEAEQGELLAFNAAPGTAAPATPGPYGAYAQALVAAMKQGGVPVDEVFDRVRLAVDQTTGGAVVPWDSDRLTRSFAFFDRAPGAPAVASAQVPFAALEKRPLAGFPPDQAYDVALARDTLPAYAEFLAAFPDDPLARRVRLILAVRREALFWRAAIANNTPGAYWTYLVRYPKGPHAGDARRRLTRLAAAAAPPPRFAPVAFDVPPPGPGEVVYDGAVVFDAPGLPPPPPPPVFLLPPPVEVIVQRPAPPSGPVLLPVPVPVAIPYVRPPAEPGTIAPPRGTAGGYARPRPYARGPNGDGLVAGFAPATPGGDTALPVPSPRVPTPPAPPVPAATPAPQPPAAVGVPRAPRPPSQPPVEPLPLPPRPAAPPPPLPAPAPPHAQPGARPPAVAPEIPAAPAPAPVAPPQPVGPVSPVPKPARPAGMPADEPRPPHAGRGNPLAPRPAASAPVPAASAAPAAAPMPGAGVPKPPPSLPVAKPAPNPPAPKPQPAEPRPKPEPSPQPPRAGDPASVPPAIPHAPDRPAPGAGRPAADHGPGEHRPTCGHPGEPPCRP